MRRILVCLLALALTLAVPLASAAAEQSDIVASLNAAADAAEPTVLPLATGGEQLSIFMGFYGSDRYQSMDEHPVVKQFEGLTGIDLTFVCPPEGDDGTFFNTIVASGQYPDLFRSEFNTYPGGVTGAVDDGVLVAWNDLVTQYMPNFMREIAKRGEKVYKHLVNDEGLYVKLGCYLDPPLLSGVQHTGMVIRKDMLDQLGLAAPKTFDELTEALRRMKAELGLEVPFAMAGLSNWVYTNSNALTGAWNVAMNAYQIADDGTVYYSRTADGFKEALKALGTWYAEGLIDRDFINRTTGDAKKLVYAGRSAACMVGNWETSEMLSLGKIENEAFDIVGLPVMRVSDPDQVLSIGGKREDGTDTQAWQISSACKDPRLAAKFVDWLYTDEAIAIANFGPGDLGDGNSTYVVDGEGRYQFTDFMLKNPDWDFNTLRSYYTVQDFQSQFHNDFIGMQYDTPIQQQCWAAWGYNLTNDGMMPLTISRTVDEGRAFSGNQNEIETYTDEMIYKFICQEIPVDDGWDEYVATVNSLGLDENLQIQTAAYQRWLGR